MKKKITIAALMITVLLMATVCLVACNNAKSYADRLQEKGYEVSVSSDKNYDPDCTSWYTAAHAYKETDGASERCQLYFFQNTKDAKAFCEKAEKEIGEESGYKVERIGKTVLVGTTQGVEDAKK